MAINYTTLLGLAQPVTGTEANTWGTVVNDEITALLDSAVAGAATLDVTAGNVTLTATVGVANQARMAILIATGTPGTTRDIIAPSQSKTYIVVNQSDASVVLKGSATTGVTIRAGQAATCVWNGADFEIVASGDVDGPSSATNTAIAIYDGTTGKLIKNTGVTIDGSNNVSGVVQLNATTLDATNLEVTNLKAKDGTAAGSIADSTGVVTLGSSVLTTTDINGGTVDGTTIGASTPSTVVATQVDITAQGDLRLQDTTGGQFVALQAPGTIASSYTLTLPVDDGTSGQALITDGSGVLSWSTAASGDVYGPASATDNAVARFDGITGKIIQNSVVTVADTTGNMAGVGTLGVGAITTTGALTYGGVTLNNAVTGTGNMVLSTSPTLVTPALGTPASGVVTNLTGTASININGTVGATTPNTGAFTTLSSTGNTTLGDATADLITANGRFNTDLVPSTDNARDLGTSALKWKQVYATTFTENGSPVVVQTDIGTAPNEIPLNQYLGSLAYQNLENVIVGNLTVTGQLNALNGSQAGSFTWNSANTTPNSVNGLSQIVTGIHDMMRGCVLLDNGKVNYYLNPLNWAQKVDGTASVLTGADGQVMVEIPKFYYRTLRVGTVTTWSISAFAQSGYAVHPAFIKDGAEVDFRYYSAYDACLKFSRSVTAVADAGGGDITVTTSAQHPLYAGDVVTIAGTTSYDATYTVVSRPTTTTFTVTATFVATETGTADGFVSGKNLDDMTANIAAGDELASVKGFYPLTGITRAEGRTLGAAVGTGWRQVDFTLWSAVQMLYLVEFQTFASQAVLGAGNTNGSYLASSVAQSDSPHTIAGAGDAIANGSTNTTTGAGVSAKPGTSFMKYRGIENFYGNIFNWADGINVNVTANGNVHVTNNATNWADDTSTNYTLITSSLPTASGFIRNLLPVDGYFLSSSNSGGSSTTYITDQHFASTLSNRVVIVGGTAVEGAAAGAFCLASSGSSNAGRERGARLAY